MILAVRQPSGKNVLLPGQIPVRKRISPRLIVVQGKKVGYGMLPSVVDNNGPHGIQALRQVVNGFREALLRAIGPDLRNPPGFVQRNPGNDRRMIVVLPDNLRPLAGKLLHRRIGIRIGGRHLAPDEHSLHITPVQKALILKLLMLAKAIVAKLMNPVDVLDQCLLRGRSQMTFLPVALIQNQLLINRSAVQKDLRILDLHLSHSKIGIRAVKLLPIPKEPKLHVI